MGRRQKTSLLRSFFIAFFLFFSILWIFSGVYFFKLWSEIEAPKRDELKKFIDSLPSPTVFYSSDGKEIARFYSRYVELVDWNELPDHVIFAFLAAEDAEFFKHKGVSLRGILRALWQNIRKRKIVAGGSTITQQLVRNLFITPERTLSRKIREIIWALKLEKELSKEEILTLYLSSIYFGNGAWGIKSAAQNYFHKSVSELTLAEAALLAALPKSPVYYSPLKYPKRARVRQLWVLRRMLEEGFITPSEYEKAVNERFFVYWWDNPFDDYFWFSEHVRRELVEMFGEENYKRGYKVYTTMTTECYRWAQHALRVAIERAEIINGKPILQKIGGVKTGKKEKMLFPDGKIFYKPSQRFWEGEVVDVKKVKGKFYKVKVKYEVWQNGVTSTLTGTIHPEITKFVKFEVGQKVVVRRCFMSFLCPVPEKIELEGAMVVMDVKTGDVLCMIGGYSPEKSQFIRSVQARRQVGSAFKPFVYLVALQRGFSPITLIKDAPVIISSRDADFSDIIFSKDIRRFQDRGTDIWKPKNFDYFRGYVTLQEALAKSLNTATVRVAMRIGIKPIFEFLRSVGILYNDIPADLTIALGSLSLSPIDLAKLYSIFPSGGKIVEPRFIKSIYYNGKVWDFPIKSERIVDEKTAFLMTWMLKNVVEHGTGWRARFLVKRYKVQIGAKTGTTDDGKDAWFAAFTPDIVVVVWIGRDDFKPIGEEAHTGSAVAAPAFVEFMLHYMKHIPKGDFKVPAGIVFAKVDPRKGIISEKNYYIMALTRKEFEEIGKLKEDYTEEEEMFW